MKVHPIRVEGLAESFAGWGCWDKGWEMPAWGGITQARGGWAMSRCGSCSPNCGWHGALLLVCRTVPPGCGLGLLEGEQDQVVGPVVEPG